MAVVDKYRPIRIEPLDTTPWAPVLLGVWCTASALTLIGSDWLVKTVGARDDSALTAALLGVAEGIEGAAEATGVLGARRALDAVFDPGDDPHRLWRAPPPPPPPAPPPPPPGVDFVHPADPGADRPRRVLVVGASSIEYQLGIELVRQLEAYDGVEVQRFGKLGTGLNRTDVFDWNAAVADRLASFQPDLVVAQFGGNDAQAIQVPELGRVAFGKPEFDAEYGRRVEAFVRTIERSGAEAVMVGLPIMRDPGFSGRIETLNGIVRTAAERAGGDYLDTWSLTEGPDGYQHSFAWGGRNVPMRLPDGVHLSTPGSEYVAGALMIGLERVVPLVHAERTGAVAMRRELPSDARGKATTYLAYVPREVPDEGLPVLYLLHGAWDDWTAWPQHAHRELQALAAEHELIVVTPDGEPFGWYLDSPLVRDNQLATYVVDELLPDVDDWLPTNGRRSIAGLSMGGHGALVLSLSHPGLFVAASSMSGAVDLDQAHDYEHLERLLGPWEDHRQLWHANSAYQLVGAHPDVAAGLALRLACGSEDKWFARNVALHERLDELGVAHTWSPTEGAGHTWDYWVSELPLHVAWHASTL